MKKILDNPPLIITLILIVTLVILAVSRQAS